MTPCNDPLFRAILNGLLSSGMHPDNAIERARIMCQYIRETDPPERQTYGILSAAATGLLFALLFIGAVRCIMALSA